MKRIHLLLLLALGSIVSCGAPNYFIKEEGKRSPHAVLALRDGATQIIKIDNLYPPEEAGATVRLKPGKHTLEVATAFNQNGVLNTLLGTPGQQKSSRGILHVDLAPGQSYRPDASYQSGAVYFFLRDGSGLTSQAARSYSTSY